MAEAGRFQSLRFTGLVIVIATFSFQVVLPLLKHLGHNFSPAFTTMLGLFVLWPSLIVLIVLQGMFFARALSNLALLKSTNVPNASLGWLASVPIVNLFVLPWLTYTVHARTRALGSGGQHNPDWSGWLTLLWWATFIGGFALASYGGRARRPDEQLMYTLITPIVGLMCSWLIKKIVGEITKGQEQAAAKAGLTIT